MRIKVVRWKPVAVFGIVWMLWVFVPAGAAWAADSKMRVEVIAAGFEMETSPAEGLYGIIGATYGATARIFAQASYGVWRDEQKEIRFGVE